MAEPKSKTELTVILDRARARLGHNFDHICRDLDVGSHLKESFHKNKAAFIGGAGVFGLLLAKLPARKQKVYVDRKSGKSAVKEAEKAAMWLVALQFLFKTFRPALTSLLARQVTEYVRARAQGKV